MTEQHAAELIIEDSVVDAIAQRCREVESGGRVIDAIITQNILPELSECVMRAMIEGTSIKTVRMGASAQSFVFSLEHAEVDANAGV